MHLYWVSKFTRLLIGIIIAILINISMMYHMNKKRLANVKGITVVCHISVGTKI